MYVSGGKIFDEPQESGYEIPEGEHYCSGCYALTNPNLSVGRYTCATEAWRKHRPEKRKNIRVGEHWVALSGHQQTGPCPNCGYW